MTPSAPLRSRTTLVWVALATLALLASIAGTRLLQSSGNLHHAHQARAWLSGQLHLSGTPPGYCNAKLRRQGICKQARHDDWAVVSRLELANGDELRGLPCRSTACKQAARRGKQSWIDMGGTVHELDRRDVRAREDTWYVSFPPGPALLFLPFVALFGVGLLDILLTILIASLAPLLLLRALDRICGGAARAHLWAAVAFVAASPFLFVAAHGSVWFTSQVVACVCLLGYLGSASEAKEPLAAGCWLAMAMATRPHLAFAFLWFASEWRQAGARPKILLRFATPILIVGALLAMNNWARFENPFEFGHRFLDIRWQTRMQEQGQFSLDYLARNLRCLLWLFPQASSEAPFFKVSLHGSSLLLGAPWLLLIFAGGRKLFTGRGAALWVSALAVALPALLYHNSGQRQFSYRFALDWLPLVLVAMGLHGLLLRRAFQVLVIAGALYEGLGAWHFERSPRKIFVTDPIGWPFEDEFK